MECPQCGYVMDPFDVECPRCKRLGTQAPVATATPPPQPMPQPMPVQQAPQPMQPAPQISPMQMAQMRNAQRPPERYEPPLGWALTILLWIYVSLVGVYVLLFAIGMIMMQSGISDQSTSSQVGGLGIIIASVPILLLAAGIAMLRAKMWGFRVFTFFHVALPILWIVKSGFDIGSIILLAFSALPIAIFVLAVMKYDEFD